ncbi:MAG: MFS transporter [Deltaproteobacteria bacterium]|nr:MFS transporter [Deltaproteobacteria bacterium]
MSGAGSPLIARRSSLGTQLQRARVAVAAVFFVNGAVLASWVPHIPFVKARLAIGDGALGVVLLAMACGALCALSIAGWLVARHGSRRVTCAAGYGLCALMPLPVLAALALPAAMPRAAPGLVALALFALGAANATLDVAMNAQAVVVETNYARAIMSSFHGLFSLGGLAGAAAAGIATQLGLAPAPHVLGSALLGGAVVLLAQRCLVRVAPAAGHTPVFVRPAGRLRWLGLLAFAALMAEGAMADWSAVYLHDGLDATPGLAAAGFAACALLMAVGRLTGDRAVRAWGAPAVLRASGLLAALGLGAALLAGRVAAAIVGCGLVGLGVANAVPILFSRAGREPGVDPAVGLAAVASTGYLGFLAGPPLIGLIAELAGLPLGLGVVALACALLAAGAGAVADERAADAPADAPAINHS